MLLESELKDIEIKEENQQAVMVGFNRRFSPVNFKIEKINWK